MSIVSASYIDRLSGERKSEFFSNPGEAIQTTYEYRIIDGIKSLVPCGETNIQDQIDSYEAECDINNIIARFLGGDDSVLNQRVGQFGDFTNVPTSYAEMFDRARQCENFFDVLPVEIKNKFDNSYQKFWSMFGSSYFDQVFNDYNSELDVYTGTPEKPTDVPVSEVKDAE